MNTHPKANVPTPDHDPAQLAITLPSTWARFRTILTYLGCPDRLPLAGPSHSLRWDDAGALDLPGYLPPTPGGARVSIIGAAVASNTLVILHAYQLEDVVAVLELSERKGRRRLRAWVCGDQRHAARVAAKRMYRWSGLDASLTMAGSEDIVDVGPCPPGASSAAPVDASPGREVSTTSGGTAPADARVFTVRRRQKRSRRRGPRSRDRAAEGRLAARSPEGGVTPSVPTWRPGGWSKLWRRPWTSMRWEA